MYDEHEYFFKFLMGGVAVILLCLMVICMPSLIKGCNSWDAANKEANVDTNWDKQKEIEDTLRSYMSSYNADMFWTRSWHGQKRGLPRRSRSWALL